MIWQDYFNKLLRLLLNTFQHGLALPDVPLHILNLFT